MSFPLENARLCLDCDTVFDAARCPSCDSESYFPLSRWVRPSNEAPAAQEAGADEPGRLPKPRQRTLTTKAKQTSMLLGGAGVAFALWKLFGSSKNGPDGNDPSTKK